jgi:hypothetical protein
LFNKHRRLSDSNRERNPSVMSQYIPNENAMTSDERKHTELPCGYTLAQSWCALRRSWVGFNIAHSKGDHDNMKYYASFIRKVQTEMGIDVTKFDPETLDEAEEDKESENEGDSQKDIEEVEKANDEPNYDDILGEVHTRLKSEHTSCPGPREQIFAKNHEKSENVDSQLNQKGSHSRDLVVTNEARRACISRPGQTNELTSKLQGNKFSVPDEEEGQHATELKRNSCLYELEDEDEDKEYEEQQDVKRNSCLYEIK